MGGSEEGNEYCLRPLEGGTFPGSWVLMEVVRALERVGLRLERLCEVLDGGLKQTSHFAIVRVVECVDSGDPAAGQDLSLAPT